MSSRGCFAQDLLLDLFGISDSLLVFGMVRINLGGIDILVIIGLEAEELLVRCELVPFLFAAGLSSGLFQAPVYQVTGVGYPRLQDTFLSRSGI